MPLIRFIQPDGSEAAVSANVGDSVMQTAVNNQIPGILGDCGGSCSCATCHAYVDATWRSHMPAAESYEVDMLTCAMDVRENSRLTCQIFMTPELDGLVVRLPDLTA
ncbi:2Fe-2S iron-sulfur cluster binding domain-containing protein [Paraburkholderia sp. 31.1]|uniref:2Fe-2S iron-sulfur cluster-binding protein n=1 Tax=Paraburkholderia sp. 31.1 TaxID=2615205 RepID=UPI00165574E1|nr:2Fe-2S iron-sulfur cluster-binding protein [Paraburkholderia sp. 31.1]MBC8722636.1 2Fe-2S iron-sulfur cluster binding domain-containing protein [Paraburkholderia sp. 31.1]